MPSKPTRFSGLLQSDISQIARRLRDRMRQLDLSQTELANRCALAPGDVFPDEQTPNITRERIAKILMHCKTKPGKSAARVISRQEIQLFAGVLQVSPEWLGGHEQRREPVLWDPLSDPHRAEHILHLINEHENSSSEVLIWAEYLICSLETPEFMHKHHEALFSELDVLDAHEEKRKLVQIYDTIGNARRKRLFESKRNRRKLIQFIFASDLQRIAQGENEYAGISKDIRRACLESLCNLIADESLGIELVILNDEAVKAFKTAVRDYDSVGVFDESLVLWRYHSGRIAWSESFAHVRRWRRMLNSFKGGSSRSAAAALRSIRSLAA